VSEPQTGIFALGTASHAYLEFDAHDAASADQLVRTVAGLREPRTTMGGINLVTGFRPEIWQHIAPDDNWNYVHNLMYAIANLIPTLRAGAQRLGLVTLDQMVAALVAAVEAPAAARIVEVPEIRATPSEREGR